MTLPQIVWAQTEVVPEAEAKTALGQQALESMDFKDVFKLAVSRSIVDSGHFNTMTPARRERFSALAQEELDLSWDSIELALAQDFAKSYSLEQMQDIAAFAKTPIMAKLMRALVFGEPRPTKESLTPQDVADLEKIKDKPYLKALLTGGLNPYMVQDRIEAVMYRALDRLLLEDTNED